MGGLSTEFGDYSPFCIKYEERRMTHIPIIIKVIDEVVPDASLDRQVSKKVFSYCYTCGGIVFYQVVEFNYEDTEHATDTCIYCAQCGQLQGGIISDPFDEVQSLATRASEK